MENLPLNNIEKLNIKEGVDFVFEQNSELEKIGNKEQYSQYLDTIFPDSKVKDIVYHGTKGNLKETGFIKKDVNLPPNKRAIYFAPDFEFAKGMGWHDDNRVLSSLIDIKNPFIVENITKEQENELINAYKEKLLADNRFVKYADEWKHKIIRDLKEKDWTAFGDAYASILNTFFTKYSYDGWVENEGWIGDNRRENVTVFEPEQIHILGSKDDIEKFKEFISKKKDDEHERDSLKN